MKKVPQIVIIIIFTVYFFAGFIITGKIFNFFWEKQKAISFVNEPVSYYEVLVFTPNGVQVIELTELEEFKRQNSDYSFLVPKDTKTSFKKNIEIFSFEVEQISGNKQSIWLKRDDGITSNIFTYEATDKQVFPKAYAYFNMRDVLFMSVPASIGGAIACFIFFIFYKRYLAR